MVKNIRGIISDLLLMWAIRVLPFGSVDRIDLVLTLGEYMKRSVKRFEDAHAAIRKGEGI